MVAFTGTFVEIVVIVYVEIAVIMRVFIIYPIMITLKKQRQLLNIDLIIITQRGLQMLR